MSLALSNVLSIIQTYLQLLVGTLIGALSVILFLAPSDVAPSGVTGIAVLLNDVVPSLPIGIMILVMNVPILLLGHRMLPGGWRSTMRTVLIIVLYSLMIDLLAPYMPTTGFSDDRLLNAIFGGITGGLSGGIVFRAGANFGGTSTLALILQRKTGTPLSTTFLYTDTLVIIAAGFVFGIEGALYALIVLVLGGLAMDYVLEGPSVIRTAVIITKKPHEIANAIMNQLGRGVTAIPAKGMYTGEDRWMLYITINRSQVNDLSSLVVDVDEDVFIVIGQGHTAYGEGFKQVRRSTANLPHLRHPSKRMDALREDLTALQESITDDEPQSKA
jgi:uncharacterized membrane-anchored protein YitT (DUF2179 family)